MSAVDAVVVGAGHNGLVAACYLARAGLRVEVVERDEVLGGAVSTVERWPGVRVTRPSSTSSRAAASPRATCPPSASSRRRSAWV
ncbi:FAD-dependent oxidoreductase, partial [Geodermatophilus chilensis]|uniref:FAD-dependent oxidoreductase n=1 Tax=Geodermatophilus chilensis TaxID=2035835 RepID=UPI0012FFF56E